jgi:predicted secreted protein
MRRALRLAFAGVIAIALACATAPLAPPWRVTDADAGTSIRVPVGTVIDVALPGNPTTGFIWERAPGDPGGLEGLGGARFEPDGAMPGQGGLVHLHFRVTREGATPLALVYRRPFDKKTTPAQSFWVTIVGEPD